MEVKFYATLRQVVGQKSVNFDVSEGSTIRQLLEEIFRQYPAMRSELLDKNGDLYAHVHIFVNGRDAPFLENALDTPLSPDDTIGIFPAVGGG